MTKDNWIKAFRRRFGIDDDWDSQLYHYLPSGLTIANKEVEDFISQVEKDAIDRGYKEGWNNAVNMDEWETRLQDAIEKTNKKWVERLAKFSRMGEISEKEVLQDFIKNKSDLLEDTYKGEVGDLWEVGLPKDHPIFEDKHE